MLSALGGIRQVLEARIFSRFIGLESEESIAPSILEFLEIVICLRYGLPQKVFASKLIAISEGKVKLISVFAIG